jgi:hypothetical protein
VAKSVDEALSGWRQRLHDLYAEWRLRGRMPDGAFAEIDQARFERGLEKRILGRGGLAEFLRERQAMQFCGPLLLGESYRPVGARIRLPALQITLPPAATPGTLPVEARLVGSLALVWRDKERLDALIITDSKDVEENTLNRHMLEPLLFFLALRAGPDPSWARDLAFHLHIAHKEGIASFCYNQEDATPDEARAYLAELSAEFLDRGDFDLLPFDVVVADKALQQAYTLSDEAIALSGARDGYSTLLHDALENDRENDRGVYRAMKLMEIVNAEIPSDAFDKIRRRLRLLDRGPAQNRK